MRKAMLYELDPRGMVECIVAEMVIDSAWRLRRIPIFETQVLAYSQNRITKHHPDWDKEFPNGPHSQERAEWGRAWQLSETSLVNLRRYENALTRTFFRGLAELRLALKNRSSLTWTMSPHPDIAPEEPAEPVSPPPAGNWGLSHTEPPTAQSRTDLYQTPSSQPTEAVTVPNFPVAEPVEQRIDPGHEHVPQAHNPISNNELPGAVGSFAEGSQRPEGTVAAIAGRMAK
jgi:hypothetical protein